MDTAKARQCANTPGTAPSNQPVAEAIRTMRSKSKPWRAPVDCGDGSFAVPLTQGFTAYIDAADAERVGQYEWHATDSGKGIYAAARVNGRIEYLHRFILDAPRGIQVDHED